MLNYLEFYYENSLFMKCYFIILIAVIGLVIGSFLNVAGLRSLSEESIVFPPSKCPKCNTRLKWYDNIPVLSYIFLLGKCRYCKTAISIQYPIVETLTSLLFIATFYKFGFSFATPLICGLIGAGIVMSITDFREHIIFDWHCYPFMALGLIYSWFNMGNAVSSKINIFNTGFMVEKTFISALIGMILAFLIFEGICFITKRFFIKQRIFGEGDTLIAMMFAAWLGWEMLIVMLILSLIIQTVFALPFIFFNLLKQDDKIPLISLASAFLCIILLFFGYINGWRVYDIVIDYVIIIPLMILAIASIITYTYKIKTLNMLTEIPFGPALIAAGVVCLFFGQIFADYFQYLTF